MRFLTYDEAVARLLLGRVPLKLSDGLMIVHTVTGDPLKRGVDFDGYQVDESGRVRLRAAPRSGHLVCHYAWEAIQGDPQTAGVHLPDAYVHRAVEVDGAIRFLTREEFESMSNESSFPIIIRRHADGRLEITQCSVEERVARSFTEAEAIQRAEELASSAPAHEILVAKVITRSKRTAVTTTRLA